MQDRLLNNEIRARIRELFNLQLVNPVELIYFTSRDECDSCEETAQLLGELAGLTDKLGVKTYIIEEYPQLAEAYHIQHTPGLAVTSPQSEGAIDYGIRLLGIPSGYELASLIQAIELVSRGDSGLKPETRAALQGIVDPVELKVFVTPT
jgi:alkyl hydroperoxide reductase subunit AhpF